MAAQTDGLYAGWAQADITPDRPVQLTGQFHVRISEGVRDPITATALALESVRGGVPVSQAVLVSCDLVSISPELLEAVRQRLAQELPELNPQLVCLHATHTHTSLQLRPEGDVLTGALAGLPRDGIEGDYLSAVEGVALVSQRIAAAIGEAWRKRAPAGMGFGLGHAVVGHNRRATYYDGHSQMYGNTNDPEFSHMEGFEDHGLNVLGFWDGEGKLTGLVVNLACPSQETESDWVVSADFWHETREELRRRLGPALFVLGQCSAAGDQSPHVQVDKAAEARMLRLSGRSSCAEIATRIADGVLRVLPYLEQEIVPDPQMVHRVETVSLPRRAISAQEAAEAAAEASAARQKYEEVRADIEAHPEKRQTPRWYQEISYLHARAAWWGRVQERYELARTEPEAPYEIHILRLGDLAIATNPFEYYLDFGVQMKARSRATQTFVVQLAGPGTYVPTERAVAGASYGAGAPSNVIGPEGGRKLVDWTVEAINAMFEE